MIDKLIEQCDIQWIKEYSSIENYKNIYGTTTHNFENFKNHKALFNYNYDKQNSEFKKLVDKIKQWGYYNNVYLKNFPALIENKSILDVGMGNGPYSIVYNTLGAKTYIGVDPMINFEKSYIRDFRIGAGKLKKDIDYNTLTDDEKKELKNIEDGSAWYHDFSYTAKDIMNIEPSIKLYNKILEDCDDYIDCGSIDTVLLQCVSEHVNQLPQIIEYCWKYNKTGGKIFLSHGNYYAWAGHHKQPRNVKGYNPKNTKHNLYIDWSHLHPACPSYHNPTLNRVRLLDFKKLIEKYYVIEYWEEAEDIEVTNRLTSEIRNKWNNYTLSEMLVNCPKLIGRKRETPLVYEINALQYYHPKQSIEKSIKNYILDDKLLGKELIMKTYKPEFFEIHTNKNEINIKIKYQENELNNKKINSCGIHFLLAESVMNDDDEYTLSFEVKANNSISYDTKLRIYTGNEWILLNDILTNKYKLCKTKTQFKIHTKSKYRIGFQNCQNMDITIKNVAFM